jgi:hypothetical protein
MRIEADLPGFCKTATWAPPSQKRTASPLRKRWPGCWQTQVFAYDRYLAILQEGTELR